MKCEHKDCDNEATISRNTGFPRFYLNVCAKHLKEIEEFEKVKCECCFGTENVKSYSKDGKDRYLCEKCFNDLFHAMRGDIIG